MPKTHDDAAKLGKVCECLQEANNTLLSVSIVTPEEWASVNALVNQMSELTQSCREFAIKLRIGVTI